MVTGLAIHGWSECQKRFKWPCTISFLSVFTYYASEPKKIKTNPYLKNSHLPSNSMRFVLMKTSPRTHKRHSVSPSIHYSAKYAYLEFNTEVFCRTRANSGVECVGFSVFSRSPSRSPNMSCLKYTHTRSHLSRSRTADGESFSTDLLQLLNHNKRKF